MKAVNTFGKGFPNESEICKHYFAIFVVSRMLLNCSEVKTSSELAFTCSKLTTETLEQDMKYVQS